MPTGERESEWCARGQGGIITQLKAQHKGTYTPECRPMPAHASVCQAGKETEWRDPEYDQWRETDGRMRSGVSDRIGVVRRDEERIEEERRREEGRKGENRGMEGKYGEGVEKRKEE